LAILDYRQRNQAIMSHLDDVHKRAQAQREQQQDAELAGLPPLLPPPASVALGAPPLTLQPASAADVPSLLLAVDRFQRDLGTLSAYALQCQRSLDSFRTQAATLKAEATAALKVQQQAKKIAEQWQTIEEQRALIQQLQEEKRIAAGIPDAPAAAAPSSAPISVDQQPLQPQQPTPAAALAPEAQAADEYKEGPIAMQMDAEDDGLPALVAQSDAVAQPSDVPMKQEDVAAAAGAVLQEQQSLPVAS
jgi:hypothetical protein